MSIVTGDGGVRGIDANDGLEVGGELFGLAGVGCAKITCVPDERQLASKSDTRQMLGARTGILDLMPGGKILKLKRLRTLKFYQ